MPSILRPSENIHPLSDGLFIVLPLGYYSVTVSEMIGQGICSKLRRCIGDTLH